LYLQAAESSVVIFVLVASVLMLVWLWPTWILPLALPAFWTQVFLLVAQVVDKLSEKLLDSIWPRSHAD
jgi:hypothetical protein